jgi:NAD(P)-dependent dehydrogenase (short-subunit alcohol dehydrogenase family)
VNVSTIAAYMWTTMGPDRPTYGLTKNAGTALMQQIAKDTSPDDLQVVSFHPGGVLTEAARREGYADSGFNFDDGMYPVSSTYVFLMLTRGTENLPGNFATWAASPEAAFLHGRFVWANWDVEELKNGVVGERIQEDEHFLKVGIEGLTEKDGGARF